MTQVVGIGPSGVGGTAGEGVHGESNSNSAGVAGYGMTGGGPGVWGIGGPQGGEGVHGESQFGGWAGVTGYGNHQGGEGVHGESHSGNAAVAGYAEAAGPAGYFKGDVHVTGDVILDGADYAEALTVGDQIVMPGMTVVLDESGRIQPCARDYDSRVVGVVAGAGGVRSALVLDRHDGGAAVAMMGKVWVLATVDQQPIRCGDMLTTSATPGHARRVDDPSRAFGCVIGKALTSLDAGSGYVRVLVNVS